MKRFIVRYSVLVISIISLTISNAWAKDVDPSVEACIKKSNFPKANLPLITYQFGANYKQVLLTKDERYHQGKKKLEQAAHNFLRSFKYRDLNWPRDLEVRDTGDWSATGFNGHNYNGTHPAVVVYYSPEVYCWIKNNRKGAIPDGGVIIKEMFAAPANRYQGIALDKLFTPWWTVMIKDSRGSVDGWYWLSVFDSVDKIDNTKGDAKRTHLQKLSYDEPEVYPESGFGSYCIRCHVSSESEYTFSTLANIDGPYIRFKDDLSWKNVKPKKASTHPGMDAFAKIAHTKTLARRLLKNKQQKLEFAKHFKSLPPLDVHMAAMHSEFAARAWAHGDSTSQWVTSDQCMGCHSGDNTPYGPNMYVKKNFLGDSGIDISPWGEWKYSLMGLAGRDPIFHAQLESESVYSKGQSPFGPEKIQDTCLKCHGAMGQRQFHLDNGHSKLFTHDRVFSKDKYGALARDGISCTTCHQMKDNSGKDILSIATGNFETLPLKNGKNVILGPYHDPKTYAMDNGLGMMPKGSNFIKSSRVCASCHTVHLPVIDSTGKPVKTKKSIGGGVFEQSTYPEWVNSSYYKTKSCQSCHMPDHYGSEDNKVIAKIANIQDSDFPKGVVTHDGKKEELAAHFLTDEKNITIPKRPYRRHTLQGINIFGLEMFRQFPELLGMSKASYMTYNKKGIHHAILQGNLMAKTKTAKTQILESYYKDGFLNLTVKVFNLAGHRFPSGVGFRRAFLEVRAGDWCSGCTDTVGVILGSLKKALPSEFHVKKAYQKHHNLITDPNDVQIYEELVQDDTNNFTTSFLRIHNVIKDNRLLPKGWILGGPAHGREEGISQAHFLKSTNPGPVAIKDKDFTDGTGSDTVRYKIKMKNRPSNVSVKLYYQSIPPRYLKDRFSAAPNGIHTKRLYHIVTRLRTIGTPIANWKLLISKDSSSVK